MHALWTLQGLGELDAPTSERVPRRGRGAEASGGRRAQGGGDGAAEDRGGGGGDARRPDVLQDPDLHTRLAATLVLAEMPESPEIAQALYRESQKAGELQRPVAEPRVLHRRDAAPDDRSLTAYKADTAALPFDCAAGGAAARRAQARLARCRREGRRGDWKDMQVPGNWESRGLPDFDGVVWFTRTIDVPAAAATGATALSLGRDAQHRLKSG